MKKNEEAQNLCAECIGNEVFSHWIRINGGPGKCDFNSSHAGKHAVASIASFAEHVDEWFRENYMRGEEYPIFVGESDNPTYETYGDPYKHILAYELECDDSVVNSISENLPDADWHDISQGDEAFYDDTANYESISAADKRTQQEKSNIGTRTKLLISGRTFAKPFSTRVVFFDRRNCWTGFLESQKNITLAKRNRSIC